ncbi:MAG: SurA N-terminal domain-containing protein [Kiritimatiellae bacterium]|nr:SurA N-terminal domain-containing protein [Kiritimatiellia bacterium]
MVILQFNKLIRNKWVWGVFAIIVGGAFAFDFLVNDLLREDSRGARESGGSAGLLAGETVNASEFSAIAEDIRGFGQSRDWRRGSDEVNRQAWETFAMLKVAERNGMVATDREVAEAIRSDRSFAVNGGFSFQRYQQLLRENSLTPERFEDFLRRRLTAMRVGDAVLGSAAWASEMEVDQAVYDMTDVYTVRVARFSQDPAKADAVVLDDEGLEKWFGDNAESLKLPERKRLRMVKFDATAEDVLAKMSVTEDEMRDRYDVTIDKYTSTDTNGVETVRKFKEVKDEIEKDLRRIAAVQFFETNVNFRAYAVKPAEGASRLDEIAAEDGLEISTSDWFSVDGAYQEGFMKRASQICPGAQGFAEAVAELDPTSEDLRYGVVGSDKAVWLVEIAETSPEHVPTFEEAKEIVRPRALKAAKADAFKAEVEGLIAQGADAIVAAASSVTNLTFAICDLKQGEFADQPVVARAASKLAAGEISEFCSTGTGRALVVICDGRSPGTADKIQLYRGQMRDSVSMLQRRQIPEAWQKWNLERLGFEPNDFASVAPVDEEAE